MIGLIGLKLWFIFLLVIIAVHSERSFYKNNRCSYLVKNHCEGGCETCSTSRPQCYPKDGIFEEFDLQDKNSSCKMLFLDKYKIEVVDNATGTLNLSLILSHIKGTMPKITIDLKIAETSMDSLSYSALHSHKCVGSTNVNPNFCSTHQVLPVQFSYLFNGTYQAELYSETNITMKCRTKPFPVSSSYKKMKLSEFTPKVFSRYIPQSQALKFRTVFDSISFGIIPHATIVLLRSNVDLSLSDCSGSGNEATKYKMYGPGGMCCDYFEHLDHCPCSWDESHQLDCNFANISTGNYCVVVEFSDPRCASGTFWTTGDKPCRWSLSIVASGNKTDEIYVAESYVTFNYWLMTSLFFTLGLITAILVALCIFKPRGIKKLTHCINNYTPANLRTPSSEASTISWIMRDECEKFIMPEILLLYPRDCDPFMKVMAGFRDYLRCSSFKVYDPWDEEIYDEVAESFDSWTFPMIYNKNVKIILVLSVCSKMFEKAFLDNYTLEYSKPHILDSIFSQSFAAIHQYFSKRYDSYQRIFVIKITRFSPSNFEFITPATVYSMPSNIEQLLKDLTSENIKETNFYSGILQSATLAWRMSIDELEEFLSTNQSYLMELISNEKIRTK